MNNKKNAISSLFYQLTTIVQGLVLPKLILNTFGSEVNGLVSSITQFLSFISLLEGGLGAVVLAELYKPIEDRDEKAIFRILKACQSFFYKLAIIFGAYTVFLAFVYPHVVTVDIPDEKLFTLVLILSMTTLAQYMFSITYRLFLQADQRVYIVNLISGITVLTNTLASVLIIGIFPSIHAMKLCSGIIYVIQPILYRHYVEKRFTLKKISSSSEKFVLKNRWSGFAQNLAHFINMNTDIVIISLFMRIEFASIYTIYMLAINALRGLVTSVGNSYQSALGKYIAMEDSTLLKSKFKKFEHVFWLSGMILFFCCIILINPFVQIYTQGITDATYYQPVFSFIIVLANMLYVIREPYRLLVLAGGRFKETNWGSIGEACINFLVSLLLVRDLGLTGVAIGTLIATIFRFVYLVLYLRKDILHLKLVSLLPFALTFIGMLCINILIYIYCPFDINSILMFILAGFITLVAESLLCLSIYFLLKILFVRKRSI